MSICSIHSWFLNPGIVLVPLLDGLWHTCSWVPHCLPKACMLKKRFSAWCLAVVRVSWEVGPSRGLQVTWKSENLVSSFLASQPWGKQFALPSCSLSWWTTTGLKLLSHGLNSLVLLAKTSFSPVSDYLGYFFERMENQLTHIPAYGILTRKLGIVRD